MKKGLTITDILGERREGVNSFSPRFKEALEEGQPEAFSSEEIAQLSSKDWQDLANHYRRLGVQAGEKYWGVIHGAILNRIEKLYREKGIDIQAQAKKQGEQYIDEIEFSDDFKDAVVEICDSFIDGFSEAWPNVIQGPE